MKIHRLIAIVFRHLYEARRNFDRIVDVFYWPVLDIIVWGFFTLYLTKESLIEPTLVNLLLGSLILWGVFYAFQRDLALGFLVELWDRNLLNLFSTPLTVTEYLSGLVAVNIIKIILGLLSASLIALIFYAFNIFNYTLLFLPYLLNLLLFALAIGIIITGFILRYTTKIQTLAWSFAGLLQPVSCVFYPLSTLPRFLQSVAWFLPTTHSFEAMRKVLAGQGFSALHFWWGLGLNVVYILISMLIFKKIFAIAKARGLLVKLE